MDESLVSQYEKNYRDAVKVIDNDVKDLIQNCKEMEALTLYFINMAAIEKIHSELTSIYSIIYRGKDILKRYESKRLKEFGFGLIPICSFIDNPSLSREEKEEYVLKELYKKGINYIHWSFNKCFLNELEYMIRALRILVEPEFNPSPKSRENNTDEKSEF